MNFSWISLFLLLGVISSMYDESQAQSSTYECDSQCQEECDKSWPCVPAYDPNYGHFCGTNLITGEQRTFPTGPCYANTECKEKQWKICHLSKCQVEVPLRCTFNPDSRNTRKNMIRSSRRNMRRNGRCNQRRRYDYYTN